MTVHDVAISKLRKLPEYLAEEVNDFIDFLLIQNNKNSLHIENEETKSLDLAESDFSDYLTNLENYEEQLARGEVHW